MLLGVDGLDELLGVGFACFVADFAGVRVAVDFLIELCGFLLEALACLTGVLESCCSPEFPVKLNSLIGDTEDLLFATAFLVDCVDVVGFFADLFLLVDAEARCCFLIGDGVTFALVDLGLGVPLIGLEALFAGVAVCLAIVV